MFYIYYFNQYADTNAAYKPNTLYTSRDAEIKTKSEVIKPKKGKR